jgi:hypothetical protein
MHAAAGHATQLRRAGAGDPAGAGRAYDDEAPPPDTQFLIAEVPELLGPHQALLLQGPRLRPRARRARARPHQGPLPHRARDQDGTPQDARAGPPRAVQTHPRSAMREPAHRPLSLRRRRSPSPRQQHLRAQPPPRGPRSQELAVSRHAHGAVIRRRGLARRAERCTQPARATSWTCWRRHGSAEPCASCWISGRGFGRARSVARRTAKKRRSGGRCSCRPGRRSGRGAVEAGDVQAALMHVQEPAAAVEATASARPGW